MEDTDRFATERFDADRLDLYTNHLYLAEFGRHWAHQVRADAADESVVGEAAYLRGYAQAIDDVSGHLEAGEGLPLGPLYQRATALFIGEQRESA